MLVVTQDSVGLPADAESAARVTEEMGLTWTVLGDHDGTWVATWGSEDDGMPQHSYTLVDARGRLLWRRADGSKTSVDEVQALMDNALR